jgi:TorA maturation chaperone TorD
MNVPMALLSGFHRAAMYRLCSVALAYPVPGRLAEVARLGAATMAGAELSLRPLIDAVIDSARWTADASAASEYVRLFDGAARCAPYEGAYGPPQMAGKVALLADLSGFYGAFGLDVADGQPEVQDHIATELEFASALAIKEAWALAEHHYEHADVTRGATIAFLGDHLARWAPVFAEALEAASEFPYYRAVAALLRSWVAADTAHLGVSAVVVAAATGEAANDEPFTCPMSGDPGTSERTAGRALLP